MSSRRRGCGFWNSISSRCPLVISIPGGLWGCAAASLHAFRGAHPYGWLVFLLPSNGGERGRGKEGQPVDEVGGTARWNHGQVKPRVQG